MFKNPLLLAFLKLNNLLKCFEFIELGTILLMIEKTDIAISFLYP